MNWHNEIIKREQDELAPIFKATMNIQKAIQEIRIELTRQRITQRDLSKMIGISNTTVSKWFRPEKPVSPKLEHLATMYKALGGTVVMEFKFKS